MAQAQLKTVCALPDELDESSGLIALNDSSFISHNDGGDGPHLYFFNRKGEVQRTVRIGNGTNTDWEDLAIAPDGRIYVGAFGNNGHRRTDLKIYVLPSFYLWSGDTVYADSMRITYANQTAFPPKASEQEYDCEAMVFYNDSLFLFSKNWTSPYTGFVKMYGLPAKPGAYTLSAIDSVKLGSVKELSWVTSAATDFDHLYLLGYGTIWRFDISSGFKLNKPTTLSLSHFSQKEGISIAGSRLYITDEDFGGFGNLYEVELNVSSAAKTAIRPEVEFRHTPWDITIESEQPIRQIRVYSYYGAKPYSIDVKDQNTYVLDKQELLSMLTHGVYVIQIELSDGRAVEKKVLIEELR